MRSAWPGIYGNEGGTSSIVAAKKKRATQLSKFMLELLENRLEGALNEIGLLIYGETPDVGQGRLAINIAIEVHLKNQNYVIHIRRNGVGLTRM
jgi:hypothetical protein